MLKLLGSLLVVISLSACYSTAPHFVAAEPADPIVGDLHCARPQLSIREALYFVPDASTPVVCEAR
jgi:hypothetical protein